MKLMCEIQDGFLLSEKDLLLRGSGEFFGYHQHGMPDLKAADIVKDLPLLEKARKEAKRAVDGGADFRDELSHRFGGASSRNCMKRMESKGPQTLPLCNSCFPVPFIYVIMIKLMDSKSYT